MSERGMFTGGGEFHAELRRRVGEVLTPRRLRHGRLRFAAKAVFMVAWAVASYLGLLLGATTPWLVVALAASLGFALAGVAFTIGHDANHGAVFRSRRLNRALGAVFDLLGASSHVWRTKHNQAHHSYTNVAGADDDIEMLPLARLAPEQRRRWFHRWQHVYLWPIYGLYTLRAHLVGDFLELAQGRIGGITPLRRPAGGEMAVFLAGKAAFWSWALVIPLLTRPWYWVIPVFLGVSWIMGFTLAIVFQLAHCVDEARFSSVEEMRAGPAREWAVHQVETTVDFCTGNRLMAWYLGGLNFQIEHHLFPKVCHVHYPSMLRVVRATCDEFGVRHMVQPTLRSALASHVRWLRMMGSTDPVPAPA
ncbi:MAG: acyl-CoA desaturase [Actinomycetota bacterium]